MVPYYPPNYRDYTTSFEDTNLYHTTSYGSTYTCIIESKCPQCGEFFSKYVYKSSFCNKCRKYFSSSSLSLNTKTAIYVCEKSKNERKSKKYITPHGFSRINLNRRLMHQPINIEDVQFEQK